ncbi:hypothetical protein KSB_27970 [Ktedonobacter robiniae]|uniref:Uncharacterized protein n=1 Tax=Ktedonobacter robiniae TaxID=2778365 RepID=A0ABQ3UNS7_9CHLR|nr:hypothetical protein KSB_27970 [Ktedonobacter robiniae]
MHEKVEHISTELSCYWYRFGDHSEPGKTAQHLVSSITILYIVVSLIGNAAEAAATSRFVCLYNDKD